MSFFFSKCKKTYSQLKDSSFKNVFRMIQIGSKHPLRLLATLRLLNSSYKQPFSKLAETFNQNPSNKALNKSTFSSPTQQASNKESPKFLGIFQNVSACCGEGDPRNGLFNKKELATSKVTALYSWTFILVAKNLF